MKRLTICSIGITLVLTIAALSFSFTKKDDWSQITARSARDSIASASAFMQVYKVLMSPRCMNCHPAGDVPLNGDDNHLHPQGVKRGVDGKGLYALKCSNCHQTENTPGLNMPPGAQDWHLPAADMKLVFQGKTAHELALQLKDTKQNGGKSPHELIEHMKTDLVKWGWKPGEGRTTPPISYTEFFNQFKLWIDKGAVVPAAGKN
jgi:hypothetical protein